MASSETLPSWIELRPGTAPVLLLAPHGGRRVDQRMPGRHKVNDLHTADLTRELAAACSATSLINGVRDRNELDLNRVTQVRRHAPWLLALLADTLEGMVRRSGRATLAIIHGWNVIQPACDLGIGMVEHAGALTCVRDGSCTVSSAFLNVGLPSMRDAAAAGGITLTVGARYPAAHPNNLLQLFTPAHLADADPAVRALAGLAAAGHLDAVQLELGIPLRWSGPMRTVVSDLLRAGLGTSGVLAGTGSVDGGAGSVPTPTAPLPGMPPVVRGARSVRRRAFQFVDGSIVGLTSIDLAAAGSVAGRLLVTSAAEHLALFTGEVAAPDGGDGHVPPLEYRAAPDGTWQVLFTGPLLAFPMLTPFLDLENGLAHGALVAAEIALTFAPLHSPDDPHACGRRFGRLVGAIRIGDTRHAIETIALLDESELRAASLLPGFRLVLPHTRHGHLHVAAPAPVVSGDDAEDGTVSFRVDGTRCGSSTSEALSGSVHVRLDGTIGTIRVVLAPGGGPTWRVTGTLDRLIPVRRPGRGGHVIHTTYARCRIGDEPPGWLELSVEHAVDPVAVATASSAPPGGAPAHGSTSRTHDESE